MSGRGFFGNSQALEEPDTLKNESLILVPFGRAKLANPLETKRLASMHKADDHVLCALRGFRSDSRKPPSERFCEGGYPPCASSATILWIPAEEGSLLRVFTFFNKSEIKTNVRSDILWRKSLSAL